MFKLYYAPGTCALASHIALEEAGAAYTTERLDFKNNQQNSPEYLAVNAKGRVPALVTDHGVLTETPAMLAFIAHSFPQAKLAPRDAFAFAQAQAFNSYLCSTVHVAHAHKGRGPRWATEEILLRRHEAQGAADHGGLLCPDRARHVEGALGDGRAVHGLRSLSVHDRRMARGRQRRYRDAFRKSPIIASGCRTGRQCKRCWRRRRRRERSIPVVPASEPGPIPRDTSTYASVCSPDGAKRNPG